jgi:serine/threonine-protein kinase
MGEVYRAKDTRLERTVAVKVLPSELSASPKLRQRLEREAKAVSSLSHPHICTLHDIGREGETDFLVMEYLEGQTLADRLKKGRLPLDQALRFASEIADALDTAHRHGVIHRDLKPGNVMLTKSGAKLLDFGLAKLRDAGSVEEVAAESALPTQARPLTEEGKIVGTYPYMAPEQLEGKKADARTDIFAFGATLYEMVTGQRAFQGESRASLIAAIMSSEPHPISELQPMTPPALDRVVKRCLAKDPDERWQSAGDLADELRWIAEVTEPVPRAGSETGPAPAGVRLIWKTATGVAVLLAASGWFLTWRSRSTAPGEADRLRTPTRFSMELSGDQQVATDMDLPLFVVSRDGSRIAWIGPADPERRIFTRTLEDLEVRAVPGTERVENLSLALSPDNRQVAFIQEGALWRSPVEGGIATKLLEGQSATSIWHVDWDEDGTIIVSQAHSGLVKISPSGGIEETLTTLDTDSGENWHQGSHLLPGGEVLLVGVAARGWKPDRLRVDLVRLETGQRRPLLEGTMEAFYVGTGHLLFGRAQTVFAVPFDLERLEITGSEVPVLTDVEMAWEGRTTEFAVSQGGTLVYIPAQGLQETRLAWVTRTGEVEGTGSPPGQYLDLRISPLGTRIATSLLSVSEDVPSVHISLYDPGRGTLERLTSELFEHDNPVWSPDGSRLIFYARDREGVEGVFSRTVGSDDPPVPLIRDERHLSPVDWSPDGELVLLRERLVDQGFDLHLLDMSDGDPTLRPFATSDANERFGRFSPDGRWVAYVSGEEGRPEIFVREAQPEGAGGGRKVKVSSDGGWNPLWSRDGRELFYRSLDGSRILSVSVVTAPEMETGRARVLIDRVALPAPGWINLPVYDIAPDGRFLMMLETGASDTMRLVVVRDWLSELTAKLEGGAR